MIIAALLFVTTVALVLMVLALTRVIGPCEIFGPIFTYGTDVTNFSETAEDLSGVANVVELTADVKTEGPVRPDSEVFGRLCISTPGFPRKSMPFKLKMQDYRCKLYMATQEVDVLKLVYNPTTDTFGFEILIMDDATGVPGAYGTVMTASLRPDPLYLDRLVGLDAKEAKQELLRCPLLKPALASIRRAQQIRKIHTE